MNGLQRKKKKWIWWAAGAFIAAVIALAGWAYLYDMPGGIADRRFSKASGLSQTIMIPIGQSPKEAVQKFRRHKKLPVVQRETADGGMLLFYERSGEEEKVNLQIEYVRKTWLGGWKWVWGGGYGQSNQPKSEEVLYYMAIPKHKGLQGPFPILFGNVTDAAVESVIVKTEGVEPGSNKDESKKPGSNKDGSKESANKVLSKDAVGITAEIVAYGADRRIWYAVLPSSATVPYQIEAINGDGESIGAISTDDPSDSGRVLKEH